MNNKKHLILSLVAVTVILLGFGTAGMAATTIDTTPYQNDQVSIFGNPDTATYGQTITTPVDNVLQSFTFYMQMDVDTTVRGEVYAWSGTKATGPNLFESASMVVAGSSSFVPVTFNTGGVALVPGDQYVLFATVSKDLGSGSGPWASVNYDVYSGGLFVFINNGYDPSQWTTTDWNYYGWYSAADLSFKADFATVPLPGAVWLLGSGLVGLVGLRRKFKR
jgi:hypothetical protein